MTQKASNEKLLDRSRELEKQLSQIEQNEHFLSYFKSELSVKIRSILDQVG